MPWWVIVIGVIILAFLLKNLLTSKKAKKEAKNPFHSILEANAKRREEELTRLQPVDEEIAQRVKKLFYSAAYHESRNVTAFHNILKELVQITKDILNNGGRERMQKIIDRVEYLCGNDKVGFGEFISIMRRSYLEDDRAN